MRKGIAFIWVHLSAEQKDIIRQILTSLDPDHPSDRSNIRDLIEVLRSKRCLAIFDDVDFGGAIGSPNYSWFKQIHMNSGDSKFLITTRDENVGHSLDPYCFLYKPKFLNEDQSWELMKKKVLRERDFIPIEMKKLGRKMIQSCNGLPLAVAVLGGLLATKQTVEEWEMVHQTMTNIKDVNEILHLSHNDLPNYMLKQYFISLGNLPYKFELDADKLLQWLMAENTISLYVAESYLKELARRCMVEVQVDEYTGQAKTFRLHTLFRHLCLTILNKEAGVFQVIDLRYPDPVISSPLLSSSNDPRNKNRRLAYYLNTLGNLDHYIQPKCETALDFHYVVFYVEKYNRKSRMSRTVESHLGQFKLVRVLDLGGLVFSKLDEAVGKLKYLDYLGLRHYVFHELPSTIGNIENL